MIKSKDPEENSTSESLEKMLALHLELIRSVRWRASESTFVKNEGALSLKKPIRPHSPDERDSVVDVSVVCVCVWGGVERFNTLTNSFQAKERNSVLKFFKTNSHPIFTTP